MGLASSFSSMVGNTHVHGTDWDLDLLIFGICNLNDRFSRGAFFVMKLVLR